MAFEFTNTTFSFIATLISSILGITYPLLMSSVSKIESKYNSSAVMLHFQEESALKLYKVSLGCAFVFSFVAPFLMLLFNNAICNVIIIVVQCISVLFLVSVVFYLFGFVMKYNTPKYLLKMLESEINSTDTENKAMLIECAADMMVYSSKNLKEDLYDKSKSILFQNIYREQPINSVESYELSPSTEKFLLYLTDYAKSGSLAPLCNDNIIVQVFYNFLIKCYNSEKNFKTIWSSLYKMSTSNNTEWFKQYWMTAIEYYSFYIEQQLIGNRALYEKYSDGFKKFHVMLGAMLLLNEKYDWLTFMLTKDHTDPAEFKVIPGSVSSIIHFMCEIEEQKQIPLSLLSQYQMQGMFHDIKADEQILTWAYRYCALLFVRLFSYPRINVHYDPPLEIPTKRTLAQKKIAEKIETEMIEFWYNDDRIKKISLPKEVKQTEVVMLLNSFIK